ncbi:hypothetical protein F0U44_21460 [Nocardioides humilatus]|uniref:Uncharacterized protein n=1 Tax=Nocardioides humilatus TaxID=2607660 RepID=A0A5B1L4A5_9ACTN|nr:hypothetical protein [Nocardioides humilatus]KAA1415266.1 hypothetical protein F0U44_21460 [Nocardioides humilatus]
MTRDDEITELRAALSELQEEVARLRADARRREDGRGAHLDDPLAATAPVGREPNRRGLIKYAAAGTFGVAASLAAGSSSPAAAADGTFDRLTVNDRSEFNQLVFVSHGHQVGTSSGSFGWGARSMSTVGVDSHTLNDQAAFSGNAFSHDGEDAGTGVVGQSSTRNGGGGSATIGVHGLADGGGVGVFGEGLFNGATGVRGESNTGIGVEGSSAATTGVFGYSESPTGGGVSGLGARVGVEGETEAGVGVKGFSQTGNGVEGRSQALYGVRGDSRDSYGVYGRSTTGTGVFGAGVRGAQFDGTAAALRLAPKAAATHPTSGLAGDLYVDGSKRLWFCKGGRAWVQLA